MRLMRNNLTWAARLPSGIPVPSFELYRDKGANSRSIDVQVEKGQFRIDTQDMGPATEEFWGDSDYEFWVIVEREHWGVLLAAFAREFLATDPRGKWYDNWTNVPSGKQPQLLMGFAMEFLRGAQATDEVSELCRKHDVPYEGGSWA